MSIFHHCIHYYYPFVKFYFYLYLKVHHIISWPVLSWDRSLHVLEYANLAMNESNSMDSTKLTQQPTDAAILADEKTHNNIQSISHSQYKQAYSRNRHSASPETLRFKSSKNGSSHDNPNSTVTTRLHRNVNNEGSTHRNGWRTNEDKIESPRRVVSFSKSPGPNITLASLSSSHTSDNSINFTTNEKVNRRSITPANHRHSQGHFKQQYSHHRPVHVIDRKQHTSDNISHRLTNRSSEDTKEKSDSLTRVANHPLESSSSVTKTKSEESVNKTFHTSTNNITDSTHSCIHIANNTQFNAATIEKQRTPYTLQQLFFDIETPDSGYVRLLYHGDIISEHQQPNICNIQYSETDQNTSILLFSQRFCQEHHMTDLIDSLAHHIQQSVKIHQELLK